MKYDYGRCQISQRNLRRIAIGKETFSKRRELLRAKSEQNFEETDDKNTDMECGNVCFRNMDLD